MKLAARMERLGTETAFEVLARAKALEREGRSIIHLEIGEPDFDTPANVVQAGVEALKRWCDALHSLRGHRAAPASHRRRSVDAQRAEGDRRQRGRHAGRETDHVLSHAGAARRG